MTREVGSTSDLFSLCFDGKTYVLIEKAIRKAKKLN